MPPNKKKFKKDAYKAFIDVCVCRDRYIHRYQYTHTYICIHVNITYVSHYLENNVTCYMSLHVFAIMDSVSLPGSVQIHSISRFFQYFIIWN